MTFDEILDQAIEMLQRRGRLTYRALKLQFNLDDEYLDALKEELIEGQRLAVDENGRVLVWTGETESASPPAPGPVSAPATAQKPPPISYTPQYLTEKILTSRSALEGERKQVTVCFADIKDSTELIKDLDPEAAQQLLDPAIHIMMEAVHRFEGTVNQVLGDGIMALFGAPIAHEDHAARACYAALAMQTAMQPYADEMFRAHGITMQIRVGLNSGEVVVRTIGNDLHMDYSAVGQTTNLASRMEQLAAPGSITLTGATLRLVEGLVRVNARGPVPVKGMTDLVEVYELSDASTIRRRLQAAVTRGLTKFVGRDTEIEALNQARERAETGHGQIIAAVGEAGVGKSRLVYEFVHSHRTQGWLVLESASVSYGKATPYFPVTDLLKRYVHVKDGDDSRTIRAKITGQILTLDESLQETIPPLLSLLDALPDDSPFLQLDPPQRRQRTFDGLKRILLRESQVQPLLLVFEDLHWIDSETQALLDSLVESLPTAQLLLLVNYRPEYQHAWGSKTYYTQLRLDPLPPASADEFLAALLGNDSSLEPLKQLLIERTEGNPFFLEESVRTLVETRMLIGESGAYRLAQDLPTIQVPATVQAVLAARIDRLPLEEKRLLQTAAVIGTEVPLPLLQAIVDLTEEALHRGLSHLQGTEFLYETRLFPERAYTFKHALTHEVAYGSLLQERRCVMHERTAQAIEALYGNRLEEHYNALAYHYSRSGNAEKAVVYLQHAGQQAVQHSAYMEAISHLSRGLELVQTLPDTRERLQHELTLHLALGPALMEIKGQASPEMEYTYTRARELCQQLGETPQLYPTLSGLHRLYLARGAMHTAHDLAQQCFSLAQRLHDPAYLLDAQSRLGVSLFSLGELVSARMHLEQDIALYSPQQHQPLIHRHPMVRGLSYKAMVLWLLGYSDQALESMRQALALSQERSHVSSLVFTLIAAAVAHQFRREGQAAQEWAEATINLAIEQGLAFWVPYGTVLRGWALAVQGQREEGMTQMSQGMVAWRVMGTEFRRTYFLALLAESYGKQGQTEEGLCLLTEALALADKTGERFWEAEIHRLKGELLLSQDTPDEHQAESCFHHALAIARNQQAKSLELRAATSLARLWQQQDKRQDASALLAPVYGWFTEGFDTADLKDAKMLLDELGGRSETSRQSSG